MRSYKVYIETNGCAVLRHETYKIANFISLNNHKEVDNPECANYIIMTGCAVIGSNEEYALKSIRRLYDHNKNHAKLIVTGCIPSIASKKIKEISEDIILITNENMKQLNEFFYVTTKLEDVTFNINPNRHHSYGDPEIKISGEEEKDYKFVSNIDKLLETETCVEQFNYSTRGKHLWKDNELFEIRVSYGCTGRCSYCVTKLAIGNFKSVSREIIIEQAKKAKELNYEKIMLMGDEIGAWKENKKNIVDLINDILEVDSNFKIGIRYIQPDIIVKNFKRLKPLFANGKIFYFCSAFQSGSERILKLMDRNPKIEPFIECMEEINKNNYPVLKHTQIIVGFPTETELDVLSTIGALQRAKFDHVTISSYSPRKGTKSYDMPTLDNDIIESRMKIFSDWLELNRNSKIYKKIRDEFNKS